jgi:hypothetical protein
MRSPSTTESALVAFVKLTSAVLSEQSDELSVLIDVRPIIAVLMLTLTLTLTRGCSLEESEATDIPLATESQPSVTLDLLEWWPMRWYK